MENDITEIKDFTDSILNLKTGMKKFIQLKIRENEIDVTYEMLQVMNVLWLKGDLNQQYIADSIQKNKASLTSLLDNLAKRKLIVRNEDPSDRRNKIISLTKEGEKYEEQLLPFLTEFYQTIQQGISKEELRKITGVLKIMLSNLM